MNEENIKIGYAQILETKNNTYVGAILVTDFKGFPLEFRYTDPISPTKIQKVLYGEGVDEYIKVDIIFDSLINILGASTDVILVNDEMLLKSKNTNAQVVRLANTKASPLSNEGDFSKLNDKEYLLQTSIVKNPTRLMLKDETTDETAANLIEILAKAGHFIDITEPSKRVKQSIELLCEEKN